MTCILTCINSKIIEIIRIKSVFDKNKNHVEKVVDLITTWFFSIYIIVVSFYCTREGCDSKHSQSLACLYSFITAYFTGFYKHPTHTKRGNGKKI